MSAEQAVEIAGRPPTPAKCECDFDKDFHRALNARRGNPGGGCHNEPADHGSVVASPALCMGCLFGCAP